ncbi:DUF3800 domain-containing protein [Streptomyces narbonensis]|uniref:DUF3800 domain-containing protein n=1 Tax=Streptomyces narbonensis TaxID=67333 RepID=A0ABV3C195_9ACTN
MSPGNRAARLYAIDDGGDGRSLVSFASLSLELPLLRAARHIWQGFRSQLAADPRLLIPTHAQLHAVDLARARGPHLHVSRSTDRSVHKRNTREVILRGLHTIADMPSGRVRVVYRRTERYGQDRPDLFAVLLAEIDAELAEAGTRGIVFVDGNGTERALADALRRLPDGGRRIAGGIRFRRARDHDLLQAADMIAYSAHQAVAKRDAGIEMAHWFGAALPHAEGPSAR